MRTLYFDTFSGISGDMTLGALLGLGLPAEHLCAELARLDLSGYRLEVRPKTVHGIVAWKVDVIVAGERHESHASHESHEVHASHESHGTPATDGTDGLAHGHRAYAEIRDLLERSGLDPQVRALAQRVFARLAEAEGKVHGVPPADVTFHEVGAVDSIIDIVGAAVGFVYFGIERFLVGTLPLGSGVIRSQHGPIPVPAPATAELLRGFETRLGDGIGEMVTPTGAALIAALAEPAGPEHLRVEQVGYGAGTRELADRPNLLRLLLGHTEVASTPEEVVLLETNIDDANPELYDHVMELLFEAGAKDVFLTPILMKKNRPAVQLSVLTAPASRAALAAIVLRETTAIGLRFHTAQRIVLPRELRTVVTPYGEVRVKVATSPDGTRNLAPEHDDCRRIARATGVPLKLVYQAAVAAAASE